jgi:ATPase family AAA domain-containing protein 3A/B
MQCRALHASPDSDVAAVSLTCWGAHAGPPGTGKTLVAKRLAHTSGLDYAILSGGDVAPLGADAVKEIHSTFDWARRSPKGMVLFVDEADAFLSHRDGGAKSEAMRSAINAMLYRTGDQSQDFMVIMATNRPRAPLSLLCCKP